ncbi:MAG: hypothetical protein SO085_00055, partial [Eubacteriales bacterium]|nr:hypothetical protein [Eubacteriales bacterium]
VYASSQYGTPRKIDDNLYEMLNSIRQGLLYNYGNVYKGVYINGKYENEKYGYGNSFPDSIRMLVYEDGSGYAKVADKTSASLSSTEYISKFLSWNWNLTPIMENGNYITDLKPKGETYEKWKENIKKEIDADKYTFPEYFSDILQLCLYEIMLGYSPTKIKVETNFAEDVVTIDGKVNGYWYIVKIEDSYDKSLKNYILYQCFIDEDFETLRQVKEYVYDKTKHVIKNRLYGEDGDVNNPKEGSLAWEYKNSTLYNGLTKQNADKLIDYILKEIIGENVVNYDYNNFRDQSVNYRNYVSTIAYLIYSQTYDGSGDLWEYEYSSGSVKLSYKFTPAQRVKASEAGLLREGETKIAYSGLEGNPTITTEVQAGFSAKPATFVRYYEGETFFGDDVEDQFAGRPYVEYQSVVIDPAYTLENAKTRGLELEAGFCFNFMTKNKNLKIAMKVRYFIYDSATGTGQLYEFQCDTVNFTDGATVYKNANGETCYENDFEASIDTAELEKYNPSLVRHESTENDPDVTHFTVPFFDSSEIIRSASKREVSLSDAKNIANLYKVIESEKGYGGLTVLDEKRVKTSFYEVVLDVIKSPEDTNTDYRFSMVLSNTVLSPGIW